MDTGGCSNLEAFLFAFSPKSTSLFLLTGSSFDRNYLFLKVVSQPIKKISSSAYHYNYHLILQSSIEYITVPKWFMVHKMLLNKKRKKTDKQIFRRDLSKEHELPKPRKAAYSLAFGHNGKILHHARFVVL